MLGTIDRAGRIIIPKAIREHLGLTGGQALEIREREGRIEIEAAPTPMVLQQRGGMLVAVPEAELPSLSDDLVRDTLEGTRR